MTVIVTLNLNGIRSAARKGFFEWVASLQPDFLCLQETRAQLQKDNLFPLTGYKSYFHDAQKKGYSGVGIYTRHTPLQVSRGLGWDIADQEGRYIQADFETFSLASLYMPSGTSGPVRQACKYDFLSRYLKQLKTIQQAGKKYIICGDWNIAHKPIDLKNWRSNQKHSGFLPEERAWLDHLFDEVGFVDAFRVVNQANDQYTWWSNRGQAWAKNVGWRIDYQVATNNLKNRVQSADIFKAARFSDHAPLIITYDQLL